MPGICIIWLICRIKTQAFHNDCIHLDTRLSTFSWIHYLERLQPQECLLLPPLPPIPPSCKGLPISIYKKSLEAFGLTAMIRSFTQCFLRRKILIQIGHTGIHTKGKEGGGLPCLLSLRRLHLPRAVRSESRRVLVQLSIRWASCLAVYVSDEHLRVP